MKSMKLMLAGVLLLSGLGVAGALAAANQVPGTLPLDYETLSAAEKQDLLWNEKILPSLYENELPPLEKVNPIKLILSALRTKLERFSDETPAGYEKPLHAHGVVAKIRFEALDSEYTGLFKGADHGLIRLSLTGNPESMTYAPGLALKFLIDGQPSQNVSALYKLSGQGKDYDFFAHELSNVIPLEFDPSSIFSSTVFSRVTKYPTKISVKAFADRDQSGSLEAEAVAPTQLYFKPQTHFSSDKHDFRQDLLGLANGTVLYEVYAADERGLDLVKINERRREEAKLIGRIVMTSEFVASKFGDSNLFFKHNRFD